MTDKPIKIERPSTLPPYSNGCHVHTNDTDVTLMFLRTLPPLSEDDAERPLPVVAQVTMPRSSALDLLRMLSQGLKIPLASKN
jgi:hypothetical protein